MQPEFKTPAEIARLTSAGELQPLIHDTREEVLLAILENPNCEEPIVAMLLDRLDLPSQVIAEVARQVKWASNEGIRMRLACHPHTPKRVALAFARQLYLFDLVRLSLLPSAPADVKRLAEELIISRVPHLPVGQKLTLARRGSSRVAGALLAEGHAQATKLALDNPFLTESQVLKVLANHAVPDRVITAIAQHTRWSFPYNIRIALLRKSHTPIPVLLAFLPHLKLKDLKDLAGFEELEAHSRKCIEQELTRRAGQAPQLGRLDED